MNEKSDEVPADLLTAPEHHLVELGSRLRAAFTLREAGRHADAAAALREILQVDPRLPEPRLELAHIAAEAEDWAEAETQARAALHALLAGGQWTADLQATQLQAFATNLLGEIIYRGLQDGDLIFEDPPEFDRRWNDAARLFREALRLDPHNADARHWVAHVALRGEDAAEDALA